MQRREQSTNARVEKKLLRALKESYLLDVFGSCWVTGYRRWSTESVQLMSNGRNHALLGLVFCGRPTRMENGKLKQRMRKFASILPANSVDMFTMNLQNKDRIE